MRKSLLFVLALAAGSALAAVTEGDITLHVGSGTGAARSVHTRLADCEAAADKLLPRGRYMCKVNLVTSADSAPPVVCPAASAPAITTAACPSGSTGTLTTTTTYTIGAAPGCTAGSTTTTAGTCTPVTTPPPPVTTPTGNVVYTDKCIGTAAGALSAGDTLIIKPGTYAAACDAISTPARGTAAKWVTIKAETDGTVTIKQPLMMYGKSGSSLVDWYVQFEGLTWDTPAEKGIVGRYVKILRSTIKDGPATDNTVKFGLGTNDVTPGAQYILLEDVLIYGAGGRYDMLVYNADSIVLRRVVARHGDGWTDTKGDPQGSVSLYNSTNVLTQNLLILDSGATGYFEAALYHPSNSRESANIRNVGAMIVGTTGSAVGWDDTASVTNQTLENSLISRTSGVAMFVNGNPATKQVTISNVTVATAGGAFANWSEASTPTLKDSLFFGAPADTKGNQTRSNILAVKPAGMVLATESTVPQGATIVKRLGKSGTLYGEDGFDQVQADDLFPLPRDAEYKTLLCAQLVTPLCSAASLSSYVRSLP